MLHDTEPWQLPPADNRPLVLFVAQFHPSSGRFMNHWSEEGWTGLRFRYFGSQRVNKGSGRLLLECRKLMRQGQNLVICCQIGPYPYHLERHIKNKTKVNMFIAFFTPRLANRKLSTNLILYCLGRNAVRFSIDRMNCLKSRLCELFSQTYPLFTASEK